MRSIVTYYGGRARRSAMDRLYAQFVRPGDLVFDIGAHVGDRVGAFRRLGAQVVAVEPQPALVKVLRLFYGRSEAVRIEPVAVGRRPGVTNLMINSRNPTVSTASQDFIEAARDASGWRDQRWTRTIDVRMMSLDGLIAKHGKPAFIKIDVEGFEAEVLAGLSNPVRALSFEFTTIQRDVGFACIGRCAALGYTKFNGALGETQKLAHESWVDSRSISDWLGALPHEANSGDIYARLD